MKILLISPTQSGIGGIAQHVSGLANSKKNIHYSGYLPKEKTIPLIRGSDILIQPSLNKGISSTLLESMACKTPIITTNVDGNNELIVHNKTEMLIDPGDSSELLKEIMRIDRVETINF